MRRANTRRLFQLIADGAGQETRAGLSRRSGLTAATVSSIVADLIDTGYVREAGLAESTGGKPAMRLALDGAQHRVAAVVLTRHASRFVFSNLIGETLTAPVSLPAVGSPEDLRAVLTRVAADGGTELLAIGIEIPGAVDNDRILQCVQLGLEDVDVRAIAADLTAAPTYLINDADADALREYAFRSVDAPNVLCLNVGDGVGAGMVIDGALYRGEHARAGELGHVRVDFGDDALPCPCGQVGCLERYVGLRFVFDLPLEEDLDAVDLEHLASAPAHAASVERMALRLANNVRLLSAVLDIETVILGGALPRLGDEVLEKVRRAAESLSPVGATTIALDFARISPEDRFRGAAQHAVRERLGIVRS